MLCMDLRSNKHYFVVRYELMNFITEMVFTARHELSVLNIIQVNLLILDLYKSS
jgi:hypothetical protein